MHKVSIVFLAVSCNRGGIHLLGKSAEVMAAG